MKKIFIAGSSHFIDKNIEKSVPKSDDAEVEIFFGDELNKEDFSAFINSVSIFGNEKCAVVRKADKIKDMDEFLKLAQKCLETSIIAASEEANDKMMKLFKSAGFIIDEDLKNAKESADTVREIFASHGLDISKLNSERIFEKTSKDMTLAESEAEKLELYLYNNKSKSVDNLLEHIAGEKEESLYDLVDAFANKNIKRALEVYSTITNNDDNNYKIFYGITRRIVDIYFAFVSPSLLSDKHDFVKRKINDSKRFWDRTEAAKMIGYASNLDIEIKTGQKTFHDAITEIISSISKD